MQAPRGIGCKLLPVLDLGTRRVSVMPRPCCILRERTQYPLNIRGCVDPSDGVNTKARGRHLSLCWGSNPGHPGCSQVLLLCITVNLDLLTVTAQHTAL
jgi:hypothetical protein